MLIVIEMLVVFLMSAVITLAWSWLARHQRWLDIPNARSSHETPTVNSGGIGFVVAFGLFLGWLVIKRQVELTLVWQLSGGGLLAVVGLIDDKYKLGIKSRLATQVVSLLCVWPLLQTMPELQVWGGFVISGLPLSLMLSLGLLWLVNLYNFMDGIDSLAASEAIFYLLAIVVLSGEWGGSNRLALALVAAVFGFLLFNLPKASVFMGDIGSCFLGYILGVLGLVLIKQGVMTYWSILILLTTFCADSTTTLLGRLRAGAVWYHPHRSHAYQVLARRWVSHGKVAILNAAINVVWLLPLAGLSLYAPAFAGVFVCFAWLPLIVLVVKVRAGAAAELES